MSRLSRVPAACRRLAATLVLIHAGPSLASTRASATGLAALHHDGQTFLTWTSAPDTGWTYRIYFRSAPIATDSDLDTAQPLGSVGDSSAVDHRFFVITNTPATFRVDSTAAPLPIDHGLFVVTATSTRQAWYAVTSQRRGMPEDRHVVPGENSLVSGIAEVLAPPRPVFQQRYIAGSHPSDVYTLWTWNQDLPGFPAMSNVAGWPYDCVVTCGAPTGPAFVEPHQRGGNFLAQRYATWDADEWVLGVDDYTLNQDVQTWWYGYHPSYDFRTDANVPPLTGEVIDYTNRRVVYQIEWWRRTFPFDTTRVYAFGYSLGGTYSMHLALARPDLVVAALSGMGKVDFSFEHDPVPESAFNTGMPYRGILERMWGTTATNLYSSEGWPVYAVMNDGALAAASGRDASFIMNFAGRNDIIVGWAEKPPFYAAMEAAHLGGTQFWDNRDHSNYVIPGAMTPMLDPHYLYRFRSDLSWPAFSHCSADGSPGDGTPASADSLGTLNGYMEWDPRVTDTPTAWSARLSTRPLSTLWGTLRAPDSLTVDVTPRRSQRFRPAPGTLVRWSAERLSDGAIVQADSVIVDALGLVTIPAVKTYHSGTNLWVTLLNSTVGVTPRPAKPALSLAPPANPARGSIVVRGSWPGAAAARLDLYDASGRWVRALWRGEAPAGPWERTVDLASLSPGLYWVRAEANGAAVTRRLVFLR